MSAYSARFAVVLPVSLLVLATLVGFMPADAAVTAGDAKADPVWMDNLAEAQALSKKQGRPILADFTGSDWCHWCKKLHSEVFDTDAFKKWAKGHVILLEVDFPQAKEQSAALKEQNKNLAETYSIQGYPTVLVLDAQGKKHGELGYQPGGPDAWIAMLQKETDKGK